MRISLYLIFPFKQIVVWNCKLLEGDISVLCRCQMTLTVLAALWAVVFGMSTIWKVQGDCWLSCKNDPTTQCLSHRPKSTAQHCAGGQWILAAVGGFCAWSLSCMLSPWSSCLHFNVFWELLKSNKYGKMMCAIVTCS